jgi:hypothetical protein
VILNALSENAVLLLEMALLSGKPTTFDAKPV